MAANSMNNFTTLIKRLEAATSRLEDIATSTIHKGADRNSTVAEQSANTSAPTVVAQTAAPSKSAPEPLPDSVEDFDSFISDNIAKYVELSEGLGGPVAKQAAMVLQAFTSQRRFILLTTKAKKPAASSPVMMELLQPLQDAIKAVNDLRDANRGSPAFNHLSAVSESIGVLGWVMVDTKPYKHVEDMAGSAQYWGNRVLKEFKDKDPKQVEWIQSYYSIFHALTEYVKQTFGNGIPWNAKGVSAEEALKTDASAGAPASSTPVAKSGGPPPPPPPPPGPPPPPVIKEAGSAPASGSMGAVFSELNKGEDVTKGLKKVSRDQMTHKNPSLRAGSSVPERSDSQSSRGKSPAPGKKPKPESMRTKKPPIKKLDGNKWFIENYDNESEPVQVEATISQSIVISRCVKTTVIVNGKANAITIDNSPRLALVIDSLVSSVDVIKCPNFALQVQGALPTILMDQVDGAQIYLSKDSMHTEVISSKSSGLNLLLLDGDDGDYKEVPLPEQLRTYITPQGKVVSEIVEHSG